MEAIKPLHAVNAPNEREAIIKVMRDFSKAYSTVKTVEVLAVSELEDNTKNTYTIELTIETDRSQKPNL